VVVGVDTLCVSKVQYHILDDCDLASLIKL
jgi:hypothetical protein